MTKDADNNLLTNKSDSVIKTGLLDYNISTHLLQKVDVITDLKTNDKSIITGAYEVVALEQPIINSNWIPLRRTFNKVTIYINSSSDDIRKAIMVAVTKKEELF